MILRNSRFSLIKTPRVSHGEDNWFYTMHLFPRKGVIIIKIRTSILKLKIKKIKKRV